MTNTNALPTLPAVEQTGKMLLNENDIFRMMGREPGYSPTDQELASARAMIKTFNTRQLEAVMGYEKPTNVVKYNTATNEVTDEVYSVGRNARGEIVERIPEELIQTTEGFQRYLGVGRASDLTNTNRMDTPKGYAAMGGGWIGGQQQTVGMNNDAARAAAAAQQGQAAPAQNAAPAQKPFTMKTAEGQTLTFSNAYDVRAALDRGELTIPEADAAIKQSGFQIPR
jgi:hypothetical protein